MDEAPRFADQIAVVTGGADGIGLAVATRLAREGATVVLMDRDAEKLDRVLAEMTKAGLKVASEVVDVADEASVSASIARITDSHAGRLDILVHCAAVVGPTSTRITEVTAEDFDFVTRVNLRASFLVTKYALRAMEPRGYGRILLFASIAGKEGNAGMSPYSSTKAAVIGLVKSAGKEFAESGITVNAIAPAVIRTPMVDGIDPRQVTYMTDKIPMKRCGTLDEVAALSCWIVSSEAGFNTGFTFDLTGGRAVY
ncbi:MAG: SDR family NAD(P)-dependent oxidoreductase [Verrucomicrobiales bacterium]|nr:SDR family oxidoreductase [Verrucomicrobiae bacterium]MCP5553032.1 SDR family oxidoreductase [Akkermansiaceae bacterium]HRX53880.1 SDR family NAD(P)-dependent oxidoreductase [Verrucomicrobiales bacterium]